MAAPAQSYRERRPGAGLGAHLSCAWVQRVNGEPYPHRTVPNGGVELACAIGSMPRIAGPQTGPVTEVLPPGTTVVGVRFRPGAAPAALGMPASGLVDLTVGLDALWGAGAAERLGERLAAAASPAAALAELERAVAARLDDGPDPLVVEAVRRLAPWRSADVGALAGSLHISERQLRRRCLAAIGIAPKPLQRMLRFQRFLALAHERGLAPGELGRLAADAGYADQPHLTRESLRLSGASPAELLREAAASCRGRHDHEASYAPLRQAA